MSLDKPDVTWIQDSAGINSCHVNDGRLNFADSMIGRLMWDRETAQWCAVLKDGTALGTFPSLQRARMALEGSYRDKAKKYPRKPEIR